MKELFNSVFSGRTVLVTGDTGFKGSWLCAWLREMGANVYGYGLPPKTDRDNFVRTGLAGKINHQDGDVVDYDSFFAYAKKVNPEIAFHLAAQTLVIHSYENPRATYETNLMGTVNFFETVRKLPGLRVAINVTSDKCYENKDWVWGYRENDAMGGKDPYSSSKGCSELITAAYTHSYFSGKGQLVASGRAGNVIGAGDWAENRIVPDFFRAWLDKKELVLRNPDHTRPWQHVLEPLSGYLQLAAKLYAGEKDFSGGWNFGPLDGNHHSVLDLVQSLIDVFGKGAYHVPQFEKKFHEAQLLKLDISKSMKLLEWSPVLNFRETVEFTVKGYEHELEPGNIYDQRVNQIKLYTEAAKRKGIKWAG